MFPSKLSQETLRFSWNKIYCSPQDQSLSVDCFLNYTEKWENCVQNSQLCWICWCCVRDETSKLRKLVYIRCFFFLLYIYCRDIWLIENNVFWRQLNQHKFSLSLWWYHFRMPLILPFQGVMTLTINERFNIDGGFIGKTPFVFLVIILTITSADESGWISCLYLVPDWSCFPCLYLRMG